MMEEYDEWWRNTVESASGISWKAMRNMMENVKMYVSQMNVMSSHRHMMETVQVYKFWRNMMRMLVYQCQRNMMNVGET